MALSRPFLAALQAPGSEAQSETWRLIEIPPLWVVILVLVPVVVGVSCLAYWREKLARRPRLVLITLRCLTLALLMLVIFRPVKVEQQENVQAPEVVVLLDDSASMRRLDAYTGDEETRAAVRELGGVPAGEASRLDLARAALRRDLMPSLQEAGYDVRLFRFDESIAPMGDLDGLSGSGRGTHLGNAIQQALASHRGRHVTDLVLLSDGRSNGGVDFLLAAGSAKAAGIPVHTVVVGDTRPERNLVIELVEAPPSVLEGDEIAISVRLHGRGIEPGSTAHLVLEELPPEGSSDPPRTLASESVEVSDVGDRVVLIAPPGPASLDGADRRFRVSVPPLVGETMLDDNSLELSVHITQEKIRVLYIDGYPRYEYRFLKWMLLRADERIDVQVFLVSATPDFPQEATQGLPKLRRVPTGRRELLDNYDVILLGDVNPYAVSPDPARGEEFVASLFEFVERGGGLGILAGEYENPRALAGTEFAKLLPVQLDPTGSLVFDVPTETEHRPTLQSPANPHEIVRLHPDLQLNRELWEDATGLRGSYWYFPVESAKPGAQVLLRHPERSLSGGDQRDPILVTGYYPSGRTLFLATDDMTWRWRFRYVDHYHERFWRNAIRWLALGRLKDGDRRYGLEPLRTSYTLDERVTLEARVLDEDYQASDQAAQTIHLQGPDGPSRELSLGGIEGRPGIFRGTFEADRPGLYRIWIEEGGKRLVTSEFEVVLPSRENANPSPDPQAMAAVASVSGGRAVSVTDVAALLVEFPGDEERREPISSQLLDAWDHWGTLLLALGLLSIEWILRKRYELI